MGVAAWVPWASLAHSCGRGAQTGHPHCLLGALQLPTSLPALATVSGSGARPGAAQLG